MLKVGSGANYGLVAAEPHVNSSSLQVDGNKLLRTAYFKASNQGSDNTVEKKRIIDGDGA